MNNLYILKYINRIECVCMCMCLFVGLFPSTNFIYKAIVKIFISFLEQPPGSVFSKNITFIHFIVMSCKRLKVQKKRKISIKYNELRVYGN